MATYHLYRWLVHRYPSKAHATVTLHGRGGVFRPVRQWERLEVPLLPTDEPGTKGDKAIVRRAMDKSADRWTGRP